MKLNSSCVVKLLGLNLEVRFGIACLEFNRCHFFQDALAVKGQRRAYAATSRKNGFTCSRLKSALYQFAKEVNSMSNPPYRALRIILGIVSVFTAVAGLLIVFSGRSLVMRLLLRPPETEVSTLLLFLMRELGGLALMLSVLFFFASRDPVRNVAIVNGLIVGLCILAITPLLSLYTLDIRRLYPGYLIWGRSLTRLAMAVVLYFLRPRETLGGQS